MTAKEGGGGGGTTLRYVATDSPACLADPIHHDSDEEEERAENDSRRYLKQYIDQVCQEPETQPLSRFLHRHIRETRTIQKMKRADDKREKALKEVCYVSSSVLVDGMYPLLEGLNKKKIVDSLREKYFTPFAESAPVNWSVHDSGLSVVSAVFLPMGPSAAYEDNLQRLLLPSAFRLRTETQRLNPRGAILAYMAMFSPDHDFVVEVPFQKTTTLRGLFSNILDGSIYNGYTFLTLTAPLEISQLFEGDLKRFCDRALECSFYAVLLTFLGVSGWTPERYPDDRFVANAQGFTTINLNKKDVLFDHTDRVWMFNVQKGQIAYVREFWRLVSYLYSSPPGALPGR